MPKDTPLYHTIIGRLAKGSKSFSPLVLFGCHHFNENSAELFSIFAFSQQKNIISIFKKPFGGPTYKIKLIMMNPSNNTVINPSDESLSDSLSARDDEKTIPFLR